MTDEIKKFEIYLEILLNSKKKARTDKKFTEKSFKELADQLQALFYIARKNNLSSCQNMVRSFFEDLLYQQEVRSKFSSLPFAKLSWLLETEKIDENEIKKIKNNFLDSIHKKEFLRYAKRDEKAGHLHVSNLFGTLDIYNLSNETPQCLERLKDLEKKIAKNM